VTIAGNDWTATDIDVSDCTGCIDKTGVTGFIGTNRVTNLKVHDNYFYNGSGDSLQVHTFTASIPSEHVEIYNNYFENTPSLPTSAAAVSIRFVNHISVHNNVFNGAVRAYGGANQFVSLANQNAGATLRHITIEDNLFIVDDFAGDFTDLATRATTWPGGLEMYQPEQCVALAPNAESIQDVLISGNDFDCELMADDTSTLNGAVAVHGNANEVLRMRIEGNNIYGRLTLHAHASSEIEVSDNTIRGVEGDAIRIAGARVVVQNNTIDGHEGKAVLIPAGTTTDAFILDNIVENVGTLGANGNSLLGGSTAAPTGKYIVRGNTLTFASGVTGNQEIIDCEASAGSVVENNTFINPDFIAIRDCRIIRNNVIDSDGNGTDGINIDSMDNAIVEGNLISGVGDDAIELVDSHDVVVKDNIIESPTDDGIIQNAGSTITDISGNTISDAGGDGIKLEGGFAMVTDNTVSNPTGDAIQDDNAKYARCHGNRSLGQFIIAVPESDTVGNLGACGAGQNGYIKGVTDGNSASDCATGGVGTAHWCECDGVDTWQDYPTAVNIAVGDDISWTVAPLDGTVISIETDVGVGILPDNAATDIINDGVDDPTDGTWTLLNATASQTAVTVSPIDCDTAGSTEADVEEIYPVN
jgi:hypothetical protein